MYCSSVYENFVSFGRCLYELDLVISAVEYNAAVFGMDCGFSEYICDWEPVGDCGEQVIVAHIVCVTHRLEWLREKLEYYVSWEEIALKVNHIYNLDCNSRDARILFLEGIVEMLMHYLERLRAVRLLKIGLDLVSDKRIIMGLQYIRESADRGLSEAQWRCGDILRDMGDWTATIKYYRMSAEQNDPEGEYRYAWCLMLGEHVEQNIEQAQQYFEDLAINKNHRSALVSWAMCLFERGEHDNAIEMLIPLVSDNIYAMYLYAVCLKNGIGVLHNPTEAMHYFQSAADFGLAEAQNCYGLMIKQQSMQEAGRYFYMSAKSGNQFGQYLYAEYSNDEYWYQQCADNTVEDECSQYGSYTNMFIEEAKSTEACYYKEASGMSAYAAYMYGFCLEHGYGIAKDAQQADVFFRLSAESNNIYAISRIGMTNPQDAARDYMRGIYYESDAAFDLRKAVECFESAANFGHTDSQYKYAMYCKNGIGITQDHRKAVRYFGFAARQGHRMAEYEYANYLFDGNYLQRNLKKAAEYFKKSADNGDIRAQFKYGLCLEIGDGIPKDLATAALYFTKSANQGYLYAQLKLTRME